MSGRIEGQTAIVTGAASGIGAAIAKRFAVERANVLAVDCDPLPPDLIAAGQVAALSIDLTDREAPDVVRDAARASFGDIDLLVNNAGIGGARRVADTGDEDWDRLIATNLTSAFRLSRALLPDLATRRGAILNMASVFGIVGFRGTAAYATAKAGLIGLTREMAAEFGSDGVRVNALAPGLIETPLTAPYIDGHRWFQKAMIGSCVLGRPGRPEEVASAALFLCSSEASFITGEVLTIDGGWSSLRHFER